MAEPELFRDLPIHFFAAPKEWEAWLQIHYSEPAGVWLKLAKKDTGIDSVHHDDSLQVALCYGWIDGQAYRYDADPRFYLQKYTPRRAKSIWSKINIRNVERLIAEGRMQAPGLAAIEAAKADGRWAAAYEAQSTATVPPDFQQALDKHPEAQTFFDTLTKANRYAFIWRVTTAKKPETRQARIEKFIQMLVDGKTFH
jgi:uncharacterized protein YdeI (YjbR/CyaY-like superfamily)